MIWLRWLCASLALTGWLAEASELPRDWWLIKDEDPFASLLQELGDEVPDRLRAPNNGPRTPPSKASSPSSAPPTPAFGRPAASSAPEAASLPQRPSFGNSLSSSDRAIRPPALQADRPPAPSRLLQTATIQRTRQQFTTTFRPQVQQQTRRPLTQAIQATRTVQLAQPTRRPMQKRPTTTPRPRRPNPFNPVNSSGARPGGPIVFPTEGPETAQLIPSRESGVTCTCVPAEACPGARKETVGSCAPGLVCCPGEYTPKCGRIMQKTRIEKNDVRDSDAPWAAAVLDNVGDGFIFVCSGSLIHPQVVLTSARCVDGLSAQKKASLMVRLGEKDILSTEEPYPHLELGVKDVLIHQNYSREERHNDLALLFLQQPATLRPGLDTICVRPAPGPPARDCTLQTYGLQKPGSSDFDLQLREAGQTPISSIDCQRTLRGRGNAFFQLHPGFLCTQSDLTCDLGDDKSGSSLTCADLSAGEHRLRGVLAWGVGCGGRQTPGVYMDVQDYYSWLDFHVTNYFQYIESYFGFNQV